LEDAEHLLSTLRNGGVAVRPSSAEDLEEVQEILEKKQLDLILLNTAHEELTVSSVTDVVMRAGKDIPVIAVLDEFSVDELMNAMQHGAVNAVDCENTDHILSICKQVQSHVESRKKLRWIENSLRETERRCHALLDSSRDPIAYVHEGMHVYANPAYLDLFGHDDFEDLAGLPILDMVAPSDAGTLKDVLRSLSKGNSPPDEIEINIQMPDSSTKETMMEFSQAAIDGEPCTQLVLRDKSLDPELQQELSDLKTRDLVTGLHNRQFMMQALEDAIGKKVQGEGDYVLLYLDVDNFKETLDLVGLAGVDLVLRDLATVLNEALDEEATAARLGDQSFAILCPEMKLDAAQKLAEKLKKSIEDHISEVGSNSVTLTCSFGVAPVIESISNAQDLLSVASSAARSASSEGGNKVKVHDPAAAKPGDGGDDLQWINLVKKALEDNRLLLVYQPIVSLHGAEGQYYEVLVRLKTPDGKEIKPKEFMPAIQDHELMVKVDLWVIQHAVEILKAHQKNSDTKVTFFIKLTTQTISQPKVLPWMAKLLQKHRMSGENLVFEMPESKVMTNLKPAKQFLKGLKQLHVQFALEQFGSGLNSFQILKHLSADYLKIDRTYMRELPKHKENQEKIKEISDQAHAMGKITIGEFVEDAASMSILWQCGVNFVQGNFLQEPEKVLSYDFD
jgi:diguanylate cyclase (GGDEF)-like protein/PAS domain S-box-containing protein